MTLLEKQMAAALEKFLLYFKSGNEIPVERAVIRADSDAVLTARQAMTEFQKQKDIEKNRITY